MKNIKLLNPAVSFKINATAILLIGIIFCSFPLESLNADSASDEYKLASGLYNQKRYKLASESFEKYIKNYPTGENIADARYFNGLSYYRSDEYEKSHTAFQEVINKHPKYKNMADVLYRIAECSYFQEKYLISETEFKNFLARYPKDNLASYAYPYLGDIQLNQKKYNEAAKSFQKSIEQFPGGLMTEDSKFGLAKAYTLLKQFDKAIPIFQELEKQKNGERQGDALFHLATIYFDQKNYEEAAITYAELDTRYADHDLAPLSRVNAGYAYYKIKKYEKAITYFRKAAQSEEHLNRGDYWTGLSYKALGNYEKAIVFFDKMTKRELSDGFSAINYYNRAICEHRAGQYEKSKGHFLEFVEKWHEHRFSDDALYFAAEAALYQDEYDIAKTLIVRMGKEYSRSPLFMHRRLLKGRIYFETAQTFKKDPEKEKTEFTTALKEFRYVFTNSKIPRTQMLARYYAGQTLRNLDNLEESISVLNPLIKEIVTQKQGSEYIDALSVQARNYYDLKKYELVMKTTDQFLKIAPEGNKLDIILSTRAKAAASLGKIEESVSLINRLSKSFPESPYLVQTRYAIAEIAYADEKWKEAQQLFSEVANAGKNSSYYATSLSGLAWSTYQQKDYEKSKTLFKQIMEEFKDDTDLGPEASFMYAQSLQNNQELEKAAEAYSIAFNKYSSGKYSSGKDSSSSKNDKEKLENKFAKNPYVYRAGLQAARVYRIRKKTEKADKAYETVLKKYPEIDNKDLLYDEWALLNYEEGNYDRADEIFKLLVLHCPESDLVDNAKLSLAQSDYLNGKLTQAHTAFKVLYDDQKSDEKVREVSLHNLIIINIGHSKWKTVSGLCDKFIKKYSESEDLSEVKYYQAESLLHLHYEKDSLKILNELHQQTLSLTNLTSWQKKIPLLLAELHFRKKEYSIAEKLVSGLRQKYPDLNTIYQGDEILGRCYKQQAKFDQARKHFKIVINDPKGKGTETAAKSQFLIAECYMIQKNYPEALSEYLRVYHLYEYPLWQAAGLLQAAKCDEALNQWENAVKSYEEILAKFPKSELVSEAKNRLQVARTRLKR